MSDKNKDKIIKIALDKYCMDGVIYLSLMEYFEKEEGLGEDDAYKKALEYTDYYSQEYQKRGF